MRRALRAALIKAMSERCQAGVHGHVLGRWDRLAGTCRPMSRRPLVQPGASSRSSGRGSADDLRRQRSESSPLLGRRRTHRVHRGSGAGSKWMGNGRREGYWGGRRTSGSRVTAVTDLQAHSPRTGSSTGRPGRSGLFPRRTTGKVLAQVVRSSRSGAAFPCT